MVDVYDPLVERYRALIGSLKHFILRSLGKLVTIMTFKHVITRSHVCTTDVSRQWLDLIRQPVVGWHIEKEWLDPIKLSMGALVMTFRMHPRLQSTSLGTVLVSVHTKIIGTLTRPCIGYILLLATCYLFQLSAHTSTAPFPRNAPATQSIDRMLQIW